MRTCVPAERSCCSTSGGSAVRGARSIPRCGSGSARSASARRCRWRRRCDACSTIAAWTCGTAAGTRSSGPGGRAPPARSSPRPSFARGFRTEFHYPRSVPRRLRRFRVSKARILIVDDEKTIRDSLQRVLEYEDYSVRTAATGPAALEELAERRFDLALFDIKMPGMDGLELLAHAKRTRRDLVCIMVSGHGTVQSAVEATKLGAFDFLEKPPDRDRLLLTIRNGLTQAQLTVESAVARRKLGHSLEIVGDSAVLQRALRAVDKVAPTNATVLITGENGTGKELVAHAIHRGSPRADARFVQINCAAIPEELIESELFGHEKGAFTGASSRREGKFETADGGTLLLDEIGDMSATVQAKVLRVLEEGRFERVGGTKSVDVDVRILAATNKDLRAAVDAGEFREDLFFRLNVVPIEVPPLRDRREDIPQLVRHFLALYREREDAPPVEVDEDVLDGLAAHDWPGNVRELRNTLERMVILCDGARLTRDDVPFARAARSAAADAAPAFLDAATFEEFKEAAEKAYLRRALERNGWNVQQTARSLAMARSNLNKKIERYDLKREESP
ncbi:sigma-54 dependent transcriptional regulator [bacterium]|nr:sigma-54 dependent transcriptional regulator [bacterium]